MVNIPFIAAVTGRSGPPELLFNDGYAAANRRVGVLTETRARLDTPSIRINGGRNLNIAWIGGAQSTGIAVP